MNRLYVHEVFVAGKIKKGDTLQTAAFQPHGGISLYRDILANVLDASNNKEVWSASELQNKQSATDSTLRDDDKSDNQTPPNGNVPATSANKGNTDSSKKQEISEKIAEKESKVETNPTDAQKEAATTEEQKNAQVAILPLLQKMMPLVESLLIAEKWQLTVQKKLMKIADKAE